MKVALVHMRHAGVGGTERHLAQVAAFLAERGDDVTIVCRSHEAPPHPRVRFVVRRGLALGGAWRMWTFARAAEEHVRGAGYDVVYGLGKTWRQDALRLGGGTHATYLETAHAASLRPPGRWIARRTLKHRLALAIEARALHAPELQVVVVNSRMVERDVVARYGVPRGKVRLIYNGVDLARFHPGLRTSSGSALRAELGYSATDRVALFLGSGYGRKGLDRVIEAFPAVVRALGSARLLVVGYDSGRASHERRAAALGLRDRVRFLGGRRDSETCYAAADLYVLPTRYDPFANTTLEALACGLPVITTETNGASELVEPEVEGTVLASGYTDGELARAIAAWCEPERAAQASLRARARAEQYPASATAQQSARVLDEVAAAVRARARSVRELLPSL